MAKSFTICSKCGAKKFVNPKAYAARVAKFGSEEGVVSNWMCRDCKPKTSRKAIKKAQQAVEAAPVDESETVVEVEEPTTDVEA